MIPLFLVLQIAPHGHRWRMPRLWLPLFLVWLALLPVALLILPFYFIGCMVLHVNSIHLVRVLWGMLAGLRGTLVEVDDANALVFINIR